MILYLEAYEARVSDVYRTLRHKVIALEGWLSGGTSQRSARRSPELPLRRRCLRSSGYHVALRTIHCSAALFFMMILTARDKMQRCNLGCMKRNSRKRRERGFSRILAPTMLRTLPTVSQIEPWMFGTERPDNQLTLDATATVLCLGVIHDDAANQFALSTLNLSVSLKQLSLRESRPDYGEYAVSQVSLPLKQDRKKSRQDDRDANQARVVSKHRQQARDQL
jgi:hypothetical protein